jgi:uncharacterized membrane protein HdeD (DUF308 family)
VGEDRLLEPPELETRLQPELVEEHAPRPLNVSSASACRPLTSNGSFMTSMVIRGGTNRHRAVRRIHTNRATTAHTRGRDPGSHVRLNSTGGVMDEVSARAKDRAAKELRKELSGPRRALAIRGLFGVAFGAVILIWPGISLLSLTLVFGAFSLFYGAVALGSVFSGRRWQTKIWMLLVAAIDIAVGIAVIVWPGLSALALLYAIGAWAIAIGILVLSGPLWIPGMSGGDVVLLVLSGLVSILFGIVMFGSPGAGALVLLALIAAFSIVSGVTMVAFAISADPARLLRRSGGRTLREEAGAHA